MKDEKKSSDARNPRLRVVLKRLHPEQIEEYTDEPKRVKKSVPNMLTICLTCGKHTKVYPVQSGSHSCEENLNNFTSCMKIIKTRAIDSVNSHSFSTEDCLLAN